MPIRKRSLQRLYRTKSYPSGKLSRKEPIPRDREEGEWCLVSGNGDIHRLPKAMIFLGREECDIEIQGQFVDKRHAVVTFDNYLCKFKIKDLSTVDGTFVNEDRIPEQEYFVLEQDDCVRLGQDISLTFRMERLGDNHQKQDDEVIFSAVNNDLPSWASPASEGSHDLQSPMAECQGCIEEQYVEHTCSLSSQKSDTSYHHPHHHPHHHQLNRNYSQDSIPSFSMGCNTWPRKRLRQRKNVKGLFAVMDEEKSRHMEAINHPTNRVSRGTGAQMNILPDELVTVKRGTPLYGQPEWWGEESDLRERLHFSDNTIDKQSSKNDSIVSRSNSQNDVTDTQYNVPKYGQIPVTKATTSEGVKNMAFTVDFGDEKKPHLEGRRSLGDFMPSKLKKIFQERQEKMHEKERHGKTLEKEQQDKTREKECQEKIKKECDVKPYEKVCQDHSCKKECHEKIHEKEYQDKMHLREHCEKAHEKEHMEKAHAKEQQEKNLDKLPALSESSSKANKFQVRVKSEGWYVSPTQHLKLQEVWNTANLPADTSVNISQRETSKSSFKTMEDEKLESSIEKVTKPSTLMNQAATSSSQPKSIPVISSQTAISQEIHVLVLPQKINSTAYLIEKMFETSSTGSVDSLKTKGTISSSVTEYEMYHEAKKFDIELPNEKSKIPKHEKEKLDKKIQSTDVRMNISKESIKHETQKDYDKASDTGTYTIEEEKNAMAENEARKNIDKVFGVDQISMDSSVNLSDDLKETIRKPGKHKQMELTQNLKNINLEFEETANLEKLQSLQLMADSTEVEFGSVEPSEYVNWEDNPTISCDTQKWETLTNQKPPCKTDMDLSSPGSSISDESKSGRVPNKLRCVRRGTGRRLPTLPPSFTSPVMNETIAAKDNSPSASKCDLMINNTQPGMQFPRQRAVQISSHVSARYDDTDSESISLTKYGSDLEKTNMSSRSHCGSNNSVTSLDTEVLLQDTATVMAALEHRVQGSKTIIDAKQRWAVKTSGINNANNQLSVTNASSCSHQVGKAISSQNGMNVEEIVKNGTSVHDLNTKQSVQTDQSVKNGTSMHNINTKKSLNKDQSVKTEQSVKNDTSWYGLNTAESVIIINDSVDFDESDTSSVVALVNGDDNFIKPTIYKSPRSVIGKGKVKLTKPLPSKPSVNRNGAKSFEKDRKGSTEDRMSIVSDVYSEVNDKSETQFSRQGLQEKGQMSMTKPNRTSSLCRAHTDSDDLLLDSAKSSSTFSVASSGLKAPKSSSSLTSLRRSSSFGTPLKPRRPMSGILVEKQLPDSSRSQASLGAQIVKKSQDNVNTNCNQEDLGRNSAQIRRSKSIQVQGHHQNPSSMTSNSKQRQSDGTPSSSLQHSKSLHVTGVSAGSTKEKSSSKPGSRASSPKSAERNAWKRRKDYDPRKAVMDSKSKGNDSKHGSDNHCSKNNSVARSSSFSNSKDLKLISCKHNSVSSVDDFSSISEVGDVFDDSLRRGFVPYSMRSFVSSKVSNSSDDEIEKNVRSSSAHSSQAATKHGQSKSMCQTQHYSAFTPPPRQPPSLSVYKPTFRSHSSTRSSQAKITLKTPSPPPSTSFTVSMKRRSVDSLELYHSVLGYNKSSSTESSPKIPESYDSLIVASIYQLSLKLRTQTARTLEKLRGSDVIENGLDLALDELENQSTASEIPAYKSANQELAGVLKNLQKLEQHIKIMNKVLFPEDEMSPDTSKEKNEYLQEIERIKNEIAGFQPINTPHEDVWKCEDTASVESDCEELNQTEFY